MKNTPRVYVRPMTLTEVTDDYVSWINDPEVTFFLDTHHTTLEQLKEYVAGKIKKKDCCFLGVFLTANDLFIGTAKFEPIDWKTGTGEFGLMIGNRSVWGKGIGVEAAEAAITYGFEELKLARIELGVYAANVQAFKTFARTGFEVTKRDIRPASDGKSWPRIRMALDRTNWPRPRTKIALFLQRNFARVGDAFAASLQKEYPELSFCAYLQHRNALVTIKQTNLVSYSAILLEEDVIKEYKNEKLDLEYLRSIELSYGLPTLWPHLSVDRVLMHEQLVREYPHDELPYTHEELLRITQVLAKRIETFLDTEKPSHLVCTIIGSLGAMLLFHMARARGIQTHVICGAQFENRFIFSKHHNDVSIKKEIGTLYESEPSDSALHTAENFLKTFRNKPTPPNTVQDPKLQSLSKKKQLQFLAPDRLGGSLGALAREYKLYYANPNRDDYTTVHPNFYLFDRLQRKLRNLIGTEDLENSPSDESYAFFPLHMEPESAVTVWAPGLGDQLDTVRRTAMSLPVGWKLYVKEHPQMAGFRPRSFYKALKKIPNVKLISATASSFSLIQKSALVVIISSTVGFEAVLFGKAVVTVGNHLINDLSFVKHVEQLEKLPEIIKEQIDHFHFDEQELLHFLAKTIEHSAVVDLLSLWLTEHTNDARLQGVEPLARLFAERINLAEPKIRN